MNKPFLAILTSVALLASASADHVLRAPIAKPDLVFEEKDGFVSVETEHFFKQELTDVRAWYLTTDEKQAGLKPDHDPNHAATASGGAYLEILPDTRKNHGEKLIQGENFINQPGKLAVISYKVHFNTPGKYFVWARVYPTGTEDNGMHVGIDGTWPESGQRLQFGGKKRWMWDSRQRTEKVHTGVRGLMFLEVEKAGEHTISFSMREDGFEFDQWLMTTDPEFKIGEEAAPTSKIKAGKLPTAFEPVIAAPAAANTNATPTLGIAEFPELKNYYVDKDKWLAIDPEAHKSATASGSWPFRDGRFNLTLHAVGENDGSSTYTISVEGEKIGDFECPLAEDTYEEGAKFTKTFTDILISKASRIEVTSNVKSADGKEFSRARWSKITVAAADGKPLAARQNRPAPVAAAKQQPKEVSFEGDLFGERGKDGNGSAEITGELKTWHKITLTLDGPFAHEKDNKPNPFTDHEFNVTFTHESGAPSYKVPGYFAADGNAGETSAESGTKWRAHLSPNRAGKWNWTTTFASHEKSGSFTIAPSDKTGRDLRGKGRLQYVGKHHLQFAGDGEYFIKAGADAPETFLGYTDFDGTLANNPKKVPLKTWKAHLQDWKDGDPTWKDGKGKGMIGAINYLSGKGCNVFSFLPYNAGGDGDNVWPFIERDDKFNYDCSKLDQWGIVFDHATTKGMYLHFKLQETENDDNQGGHKAGGKGKAQTSLDGGDLGPERKLYCREIVARYGHLLALNWNLGEENTQSTQQQKDMAKHIADLDPYHHLIVVHTFPDQQDKVYRPLLGNNSVLSGASLQNSNVKDCHSQVVKWTSESAAQGKPWVIGFDEPGSASEGMPADPGYPGMPDNFDNPSIHTTRKQVLWGTLLAGGSGVEYYFGYKLPQNDLVCEDWRSRDKSWDYCRIALDFFRDEKVPFAEMTNMDALVGNPKNDNSAYCYGKFAEDYLVYLPIGGTRDLDLSGAQGTFKISWFNPREGGPMQVDGTVKGGQKTTLTAPDTENDWLARVKK
jgi:hypothetical protein